MNPRRFVTREVLLTLTFPLDLWQLCTTVKKGIVRRAASMNISTSLLSRSLVEDRLTQNPQKFDWWYRQFQPAIQRAGILTEISLMQPVRNGRCGQLTESGLQSTKDLSYTRTPSTVAKSQVAVAMSWQHTSLNHVPKDLNALFTLYNDHRYWLQHVWKDGYVWSDHKACSDEQNRKQEDYRQLHRVTQRWSQAVNSVKGNGRHRYIYSIDRQARRT